jgi:hypothetical protein
MVAVIFVGGFLLGIFLGFAIMVLLAAGSLDSKPKRPERSGVILLAPSLPPVSLALRKEPDHRPPQFGSSPGFVRGGGPRLSPRVWQ